MDIEKRDTKKVTLVEASVDYLISPADYWGYRYKSSYNSVDMAERFEKYATMREWEYDDYNDRGWVWNEEIGR